MTTEGTYPCYGGGVSHWCDQLIRRLPDYDFDVLAITNSPHQRPIYSVPANVRDQQMLPLWGTEEAGWQDQLISAALQKRLPEGTWPEGEFIRSFERTVMGILDPASDPRDLADGLCGLWRYFRIHDYAQTMSSLAAWDAFRRLMFQHFPGGASLTMGEITSCMRWLLRYLAITSVPLRDVQIVHASMAGLAGVPGVLHKRIRGTPFVLTEHGIYLREMYLTLANSPYPVACRRFLLRLTDALVRMNYHHADVVTSLCEFNRKWQARLGGDRAIIATPNGADPEVFHPREGGAAESQPPVILTLARIFRLKGVDLLLKAAPRVRAAIPGLKIRILGDVADAAYFDECREIVRANALEDCVEFGKTSHPARALRQATVACLPSVSEAFPFALVEAMLCGCPVVASNVGGVAEVLGGTGVIFPSLDFEALADSLIFMLEQNAEGVARRAAFGAAARKRALAHYTLEKSIGRFAATYAAVKERNVHSLDNIETQFAAGATA